MIVYHIAVTTAEDYLTRREPHRREHIERLQGLRAAGILIGGGPVPDGTGADLVYRLQQPAQIKHAMEEDPYWTSGAWTAYEARSFTQFVEPWEMVPVVLDGSRRVTIVEGTTADHDMAQFSLIEMRGAGRLAFGGFFEGGETFALTTTADGAEALTWFAETGFWTPGTLTARAFLHVL
ncbi:MAG: YciI family protein [Candidatus Rokuibacteriota bacterium]